MYSDRESALFDHFDASYRTRCSEVMLAIEKSVCGCDFGASSWTTREQADGIAADLGLGPGRTLVDIGAGSGWPSLYVAERSGCSAFLIDVPEAGLEMAARRAGEMGLSGRVELVAADAARTGLPGSCADAITHSDVLCCLPHKAEVLAECRRLIRPDGEMLFTVIHVPEGLSRAAHLKGVEAGPEFVESDEVYPKMLRRNGWSIMHCEDLSAALGQAFRRQLAADESHAGELRRLLGTAEFRDRLKNWAGKIEAVREGVLRRTLFRTVPA